MLANNLEISLSVYQLYTYMYVYVYWLYISPQQRDGLILHVICRKLLFFSMGNFLQNVCKQCSQKCSRGRQGSNLVAEKMLLASAACEQLNSMESSRLVYLYNLDPPGDPWCRTMNLWRQHCLQWVGELLFILSMLKSPGLDESFTVYFVTGKLLSFTNPLQRLYSLIHMGKKCHMPFISAYDKWQSLYTFLTQ